MPQNDYLAFAAGAGANVLTQAQFAALTQLAQGFQSGVLTSVSLNKLLRQHSVVSAALTQMVVDQTGAAVTDDGSVSGLEAKLITTIKALAAVVAAAQITALSLGNVSQENIGQGLEDDGAGNLRVKLADASVRRSTSGVQAVRPVGSFGAGTNLVAGLNGYALVATSVNSSITSPATSALWNGFNVSITALAGVVTFTPNAADKINGGPAGVSYTVLSGQSVEFATDGAGNWYTFFQTGSTTPGTYSPRYINAAQTLGAGSYAADTTSGAFTATLAAGVAVGTILEFFDPFGTWDVNPLTIGRNGSTILGLAEDLIWNVRGEAFRNIYNGSDWRLF